MKNNQITLIVMLFWCPFILSAQNLKVYQLKSPNSYISVNIEVGAKMRWSVEHKGQQIIAPSAISLTLQNGEILGDNAKVKPTTKSVNTKINTINYVESVIDDVFNQITLDCKGNYGVVFRAYDDAVAYRFFTKLPGEIVIKNEEANFNFTDDYKVIFSVERNQRGGQPFNSSFENIYRELKLSQFPSKDSLAFLPVLVEVGQNKKAELFEVDLEDYPGMFVKLNETGKGFKGVFAPYPLEVEIGGYSNLNLITTKRANVIKSSFNVSYQPDCDGFKFTCSRIGLFTLLRMLPEPLFNH